MVGNREIQIWDNRFLNRVNNKASNIIPNNNKDFLAINKHNLIINKCQIVTNNHIKQILAKVILNIC